MRFRGMILTLGFTFWAGCVPKPTPTPPPPVEVNPVVGRWETPGKEGAMMRMVFEPGGHLSFTGGMEFYNPARWDWNPQREELTLSFPYADDRKLQIFKLSVGDGVKSFDRVGKHVTYHFDEATSVLNVAGWTYTKDVPAPKQQVIAEPTLR